MNLPVKSGSKRSERRTMLIAQIVFSVSPRQNARWRTSAAAGIADWIGSASASQLASTWASTASASNARRTLSCGCRS